MGIDPAIHGGKAKNDRIDSHKIAVLLIGGMIPMAYVYPPEMRATRDLMLFRLLSVPGIGQTLSLIILYEIHDIDRFPRVQDFVSYSRLVKSAKESAGKRYGNSGAKIGNAHLKWAFSEAAVLSLKQSPEIKKYKARLVKKHGKAKALTILAHKIGRAVYYMLKRKEVFNIDRFLNKQLIQTGRA